MLRCAIITGNNEEIPLALPYEAEILERDKGK
jgi:hypothetical protein